jgi:hypothetical protein
MENTTEKNIWSSGESVSPSNTNSDTLEWLDLSIVFRLSFVVLKGTKLQSWKNVIFL